LEGSVRWEKRGTGPDRIRVTPQLIRVSDDRHLWADRYDADLADIFQVQGSIAERVTDALNVALGGSERAALGAQPTNIPAAYDYYLRGLEYERNRGADGIRRAVEMYQKAVTLDPGFALGFARLAKVHALLYWFHRDRSDARLALSKQAADSALRLSPTLPEGHIAMGLYHYWGHLNYEAALKEFSIAQARRPNDSELLYATGLVQRRQGRWREAMASLGRASELSPRALDFNIELAGTAFVTRDWATVERTVNRLLAFHPDKVEGYELKAFLAILAQGDTAAASAALRDGLAQSDSAQLLATYPAYLLKRDPALGPAFDRVSVAAFFGDSGAYYSWRAWLELRTGERPSEGVYWDSLRAFAERRTAARPNDATYHIQLGAAYAGLGRKSEAIHEGRKGLELVPPSRDALAHFQKVWDFARILVTVGDHDAAIDQIEYLGTIPSWFTRNGFRYFPEWEPLHSNPRFQRVVAGMK
ncbi:MAG TPA: hypothetical protein VFS51_09475, partial [Gemmatimonadales bacterium]|nr:hypothetical protein [Gemmatimonadales bacterium]